MGIFMSGLQHMFQLFQCSDLKIRLTSNDATCASPQCQKVRLRGLKDLQTMTFNAGDLMFFWHPGLIQLQWRLQVSYKYFMFVFLNSSKNQSRCKLNHLNQKRPHHSYFSHYQSSHIRSYSEIFKIFSSDLDSPQKMGLDTS